MHRMRALLLIILLAVILVLMPSISLSDTLPTIDDGCEECHSEFKAFTITVDAPLEVPNDYDFEYKVIVRNNGEHTVQDLSAEIDITGAPHLEPAGGKQEPYHDEASSSVGFGSTSTHTFPVENNASSALIILDGDEGLLGRNDIDIFVESPNGKTWESTSPGADEQVELDEKDIERGGGGEYTATVQYFVGRPPVSYTLTIDVLYEGGQGRLQGPDLEPGEEHVFIWPFHSNGKGDNSVDVSVTGTAYHEHEDPVVHDSEVYTYEASSDLKVGDKLVYDPPSEEFETSVPIIFMERVTGLLSAFLLIISIATSNLFRPIGRRVDDLIGGAAKRVLWHCRISFGLLILALLHGLMLPFSPYIHTGTGAVLGPSAFLVLGSLGLVGWKQKILQERLGSKKWRRLHLLLTILAVIIVLVHAAMEGTDFAWIR